MAQHLSEQLQRRLVDFPPWSTTHNQISSNATNHDLAGQMLLVLSQCEEGRASFALHCLLHRITSLGPQVTTVIISANHSRKQYEGIFRSQGLDLSRLEASGRVVLLLLTFQELMSANNTSASASTSLSSGQLTWEELIRWEENGMPVNGGHGTIALVVDDLEALELLATSPKCARAFVSSCLRHMQTSSTQQSPPSSCSNNENSGDNSSSTGTVSGLYCFMAFGRCPVDTVAQFHSLHDSLDSVLPVLGASALSNYSPMTEDAQPVLSEYLRYRTTINVRVSPLLTGFSTDVHGIITVSYPYQNMKRLQLQYKALDSGVVCNQISDSKSTQF